MRIGYTILLTIIITFGISLIYLSLTISVFNLKRIEFEIKDEKVDDFAYWLDDIDKDEIKNSKYDLIIIDYSSDGTAENEFTNNDINDMKSSGSKEKFLLSYISIGESEDYRFYWQEIWDNDHDGNPDPGAPEWLDIENPDWEGNYKVKYWDEEWQSIIYGDNNAYLDKIISKGFNGVYLDIIDAFEYFEEL